MSQELGSNSLAFYLTQKFEKEKKKRRGVIMGCRTPAKGFGRCNFKMCLYELFVYISLIKKKQKNTVLCLLVET